MENLYKCEKCSSTNIARKKNKNILLAMQPTFTTISAPGSLKTIHITRCICCNCGYIWTCIDNKEDLKRLEKGYGG